MPEAGAEQYSENTFAQGTLPELEVGACVTRSLIHRGTNVEGPVHETLLGAYRAIALLEGIDPRHAVDAADEVVVSKKFDAIVAQSLATLPAPHRQVVELVDINGLSYAEAAEVIGMPVGTVMSRLHRSRAHIRQRLTAAGLAPKRSLR
ncbi:MAG: sigma factor-like helix-turn-helix DNA-binding protein [Acidimicrobiales bacterium]